MDHIRLVTQISIHELPAALHLFERIFEKVEGQGFKLLYDMKFKYIAQKLDFSGDNLSLALELHDNNDLIQKYLEYNKRWTVEIQTENQCKITSVQPVRGQTLMDDLISLFKTIKDKELLHNQEEFSFKAKPVENEEKPETREAMEESKEENIEISQTKDETDLIFQEETQREIIQYNSTLATENNKPENEDEILVKDQVQEGEEEIPMTAQENQKMEESEVLDLNRIDVAGSIQEIPKFSPTHYQESEMIFEEVLESHLGKTPSPEKSRPEDLKPNNDENNSPSPGQKKSDEGTVNISPVVSAHVANRDSFVPEESKEGTQILSLSRSADFASLEYDNQQLQKTQTPSNLRTSRIGQMFQKYMSENGKSPLASAKRNNTFTFGNKNSSNDENLPEIDAQNQQKPVPEPLSKEHRSYSAGVFSNYSAEGKDKLGEN